MKQQKTEPSSLQFPFKLHCMLDDACTNGFDEIVSWDDGNVSFKVHNKDDFLDKIVPKYFKMTKYRSFQRMLNMWGFERIKSGRNKGAYAHEHFKRGEPNLCRKMKCQKVKKTESQSSDKKKKASISKRSIPSSSSSSSPSLPTTTTSPQKENDITVVSLHDGDNTNDDYLLMMEGQTVDVLQGGCDDNYFLSLSNDSLVHEFHADDGFLFQF